MPCQVKWASSGSSTWKLKESVPTSAIIASGIHSAGVRAHVAQREPHARRGCALGGAARSAAAARSIARSAMSIATNDSALSAKHGPTPSSAITVPASAGPTMRAVWTTTEFSATALTTRSCPTSSITNDWRAGLSIASTEPRASTSAKHHPAARRAPVATSAHSVSAGSAISACVYWSRRRFGTRSASRPPQAPNSSIGRNCRAAVRPTQTPEPVSCTISHISATICIQLPVIETTWPAKYRR